METEIRKRICSAERAAKLVSSHDRLVFSHAAGAPRVIPGELARRAADGQLTDVEIFHMLCLGETPYTEPSIAGRLRHNAGFAGANTRKAIQEDLADFTPCFFYEVPRFFREGTLPVDVAVIQVSRPDRDGRCSYGVSCDYTKPAAQAATRVIAEMNDRMPYVHGDNFIQVEEIDRIVETSLPVYEIEPPQIGAVEKRIGWNCASLIKDGATLQLGIGGIPDAVLSCLKDKKNLGIHTEMFSDGVLELVKSGVINGSAKTLHQGKMVATFLMGSQKLYDFVDHNPDVELYPVDYVNDPRVIARNKNMVSINSCIEVDLFGQVCSEMIGKKQFSGTGGQVDYVRGAAMSEGGISIMAMPSTAAKGKISRIVPFLTPGAAVTTSRNDVDYVVTEYGVARLKGLSLRKRAEALIRIAHPDYRESLSEEFYNRFPSEIKTR